LPEEVVKAVDKATDYLKERVEKTKPGSNLIVVGVGNTCGVPNTKKGLNNTIESIKRRAKKLKKEEDEKNKGFFKKKTEGTGNTMISRFNNMMFSLMGKI